MITPKRPPYSDSKADPEKTQGQINTLLREYGVQKVQWTTEYDLGKVELSFMVDAIIHERQTTIAIKILPPVFVQTRRTWNSKKGYYEKIPLPNWAQSFRMLYWWLKAKLEAVAYGLTTVEQEFLSQVVLTDQSGMSVTVGQALTENIATGRLLLESKAEPEKARVVDMDTSGAVEGEIA